MVECIGQAAEANRNLNQIAEAPKVTLRPLIESQPQHCKRNNAYLC